SFRLSTTLTRRSLSEPEAFAWMREEKNFHVEKENCKDTNDRRAVGRDDICVGATVSIGPEGKSGSALESASRGGGEGSVRQIQDRHGRQECRLHSLPGPG